MGFMFISSAIFHQMDALTQMEPVVIDARKSYTVVQGEDPLLQKIYRCAKWIFPMVVTYGLAQALQLSRGSSMRLVVVHLAGVLLNHLSSMGKDWVIQSICYSLSPIFPVLLTYGFAKGLQLSSSIKIGLVSLHLTYSLLQFFVTLMILPAASPFLRLNINGAESMGASKALLICKNFFSSYISENCGKYHFSEFSDEEKQAQEEEHLTKALIEGLKRENWQTLHFSLKVDDITLDGVLVRKDLEQRKRWLAFYCGNGHCYEEATHLRDMLNAFDSNGLFFNYPGVNASSGPVNKKTLKKASEAIINFLEDPNGIGAKEIILYGFSIGGGMVSEGLRGHRLKEGIHYLAIKDRTFSSTSKMASSIGFGRLGVFVIKLLGLEFDCLRASREEKVPEMIIQRIKQKNKDSIEEDEAIQIAWDGVIPKEAALADQLSKEEMKGKCFIGTSAFHCGPLNWQKVSEEFETFIEEKWKQPGLY